jgi:hypothetical protein
MDMATLLDPGEPEVRAAARARDILAGMGARPIRWGSMIEGM